jgi:DNA-binding MarR family transcriptional regulator
MIYNKSFLDFLDCQKKRIKGKSLKIFIDDFSVITHAIDQLQQGSQLVKDFITVTTSEGHRKLLSFSVTSIGRDASAAEGFLFVGSDVTVDVSRFGRLQDGNGYLVSESSDQRIIDIINFLQMKGYEGLFFTRGDPSRIQAITSLPTLECEIYPEIPYDKGATEAYLTAFLTTLQRFSQAHPKSFFVFERLDFLLTHFDFNLFLKWFYAVSSLISEYKVILFLHIPPGLFSDDKLVYLQSEFSNLPEQQIADIALEEHLYKILQYIQGTQDRNILVSYQHIGRKFQISKVTTKRRLDVLESMELISVREKGRMKLISLTAKGETLLNKREVL